MNDFELMSFKNSRREKIALATETVSGDRFVIRQISNKGAIVKAILADGTTAKSGTLRFIERFTDAKAMQKFLLKQ